MSRSALSVAALAAVTLLAACQGGPTGDVSRSGGVNVVDESDLNHIMLTVGDPRAAVAHFQRTLAEQPDRTELKRGLAISLARAGDHAAAAVAWGEVAASADASHEDRVEHAGALIRTGAFDAAGATLAAIPPTWETYDRYRLEAIVADAAEDWGRADAFYENAAGLTANPAGVYNNWGYSKLTRGDHRGAEEMFHRALRAEPGLFTAKNNLVLALGAQRRYELPLVSMTQVERAQLLHTMGLTAVRQGDVSTGRTLLAEAVDSHPRHFDAAARALATLDGHSG